MGNPLSSFAANCFISSLETRNSNQHQISSMKMTINLTPMELLVDGLRSLVLQQKSLDIIRSFIHQIVYYPCKGYKLKILLCNLKDKVDELAFMQHCAQVETNRILGRILGQFGNFLSAKKGNRFSRYVN